VGDSNVDKARAQVSDDRLEAFDAYLDKLQQGIQLEQSLGVDEIISLFEAIQDSRRIEGIERVERGSIYSRLSPTFSLYQENDGTVLHIPLDDGKMQLGIDDCKNQKTILEFFEFKDEDIPAILQYSESARFCDAPAFADIKFPCCGIYGNEEYLDILISSSVDVLVSNCVRISEFDALISALSKVLSSERTSWELDVERVVARVVEQIPLGLYHARVSWIIDTSALRQANRTFSEIVMDDNPSIGELYMAEKASIGYSFSIFDYLASQEKSVELLYCGAAAEAAQRFKSSTIDIIAGRNALLGNDKQTLEEIGQKLGVTRERVRQVESTINKSFVIEASKRMLSWRIAVVSVALMKGGGGDINDLNKELLRLPSFYDDPSFLNLLKLTSDVVIDGTGDGFYLQHLPCLGCKMASNYADSLISSGGHVEITDLTDKIGCSSLCFGLMPSAAALAIMLREKNGLIIAGSAIGARKNAAIKAALNPQSVSGQVRAVMQENKRPITAGEVADIVSERMGKAITDSAVLSYMSRPNNDCLLWDRSTYLLREYAPFPEKLLNNIVASLEGIFSERKTPILGVNGVFDLFADELRSAGISYPQALYSELRIIDDKRFTLKEYPWICSSQKIGERTTFAKYLYSVVERNNGYISDEHAGQIVSRAMAQIWQLDGLSIYSPFLMHANGGWYALEAMKLDYGAIEQVVNKVAATMHDGEIVSAKKVFSDYESLLFRSGVRSYDILYRTIDLMEGLPLKISRIPHLIKSGTRGQSISVREAIRSFILNKNSPCSQEEIFDEFVTKGGIIKTAISPSIFLGDGIFEINNQVYCSDRLLELPAGYITDFDLAIGELFRNTPSVAGFFYPRMYIEDHIGKLPAIQGFTMTGKLVSHLFTLSKTFELLGHNHNCIVFHEDHPDISNDEQFYAAILERQFNGWAAFDDFAEFCKTYDIVDRLTPAFFDSFNLLEVSEYSIRIK